LAFFLLSEARMPSEVGLKLIFAEKRPRADEE
jgi:hypothetical protein